MTSTSTETTQAENLPISESDWMPRHFDFNGTEKPVSFDEIIADPAYQMRTEGTNPEVVKRYAEIMKQNDPDGWLAFPLIRLLRRKDADSKLFLISGFHRLEAMKLNGYDKIEAVVSRGTHLNALIFAAGENSDRSQPRTNADIQNIVEMFLTDPELCQWSNAQIARWAQVDAQTVTNHERRLMSTPNFGIESRPETRKFINKHGNISERKAPPPPASDAIRVSPRGETVKLGGLRNVLGRLHAEGSLDDQVGDGTRHASLYETDPENVLALRDEILADSEQAKEEEGPDLQGLKEAVYDLLDEEGRIYVPELAHKYSVPLDEAESIVAQAKADFEMETAEKRKKALMDEYDDLSSEVQHLWGTHLKRSISWEGLFAAAQAHWMSLEDSHNYSPADESEESLKLQIGIWKNFKEDLEYTVRVIHHQGSERGEIWLLKRLVIKPKREEQPTELQIQPLSDPEPKEGKPQEPTWIQIIVHGQHHTGEVDRHVFRVDTPMADEYMVLIGNAAMEAAKEAYTRISAERDEEVS